MATAYPGGLRKRGGLLDYEDTIQATPRNPFFGGVADLLGQAYKLPEMPRMGVPGLDFVAANRNRLMDLLNVGDVQKTAEAMAYSNRLGTGRGMTYQPLPETMGAAMAVAPMVAPAARMVGEGVAATGRFVAPKAGQLAEQYMVNTGGILPLDVYHGSPHIFPPTPRNPLGEFDASKIGTGEGAQAYGHGIYVAESPGVATDYAKKLGPSTAMQSSQDIRERMGRFADAIAQRYKPDAISPIQDVLLNPDKYPQRVVNATKKISEAEDAAYLQATKGNLYKVDLPDKKIARMLDWDKPLSDQPEFVKNTLINDMGVDDNWASISGDSSGGALYDAMLKEYGSPEALSAALMNQGIPGIKYLDATSRSAGKGTRNFVVFPGEEKSMTILERNGQRAEELKRLQAGGLLAP